MTYEKEYKEKFGFNLPSNIIQISLRDYAEYLVLKDFEKELYFRLGDYLIEEKLKELKKNED